MNVTIGAGVRGSYLICSQPVFRQVCRSLRRPPRRLDASLSSPRLGNSVAPEDPLAGDNFMFDDLGPAEPPTKSQKAQRRNIVEGGYFSRPSDHRSTLTETSSFSTSPLETPYRRRKEENERPSDLLMESVRKSRSCEDTLRLVERHEKIMNHHHLSRTVSHIFDQIMKWDPLSEEQKEDLLRDPRFAKLCTRLIRSSRFINPNDAMEILKLLSVLRAPQDSRIVQTFLHLVKEQINEMSLPGLCYCGFLMKKFPENKVAQAMLIALPIAFEYRMHKEMDPKSLPELRQLLRFCSMFGVRSSVKKEIVDAMRGYFLSSTNLKHFSVQDAAALFILLDQCNALDEKIIDVIADTFERGSVTDMKTFLAKKMLSSIRYCRAKHPADFPANHRICSIEKRLNDSLPTESKDAFDDNCDDVVDDSVHLMDNYRSLEDKKKR
ncbi:hypothetical protein RvY_12675 [Ramazzottius varieornatus]|uniref:FAST kinase leucine-rich domain-containing protein n=1 Tax=Ramazzottius varieornatus TaxID=947166 RepID=A0A1D1VPH3_RAMVA|nr:hypothetical protein RvY_12675 [Ramazzottius varieornatus]